MDNFSHPKPVALFIFAHQDDEFGVFQKIIDEQRLGRQVCCAYLTDGATVRSSSYRRNCESVFVLSKLGVQEADIFFSGQSLGITDSSLYEHIETAANWLIDWISSYPQVLSLYVPAWEGGHHDHDVLHAIVATISDQKGLMISLKQFSLYNANRCFGPFFRILSPLKANGLVEETRIPIRHRFRFLFYCLCYPSQKNTWIGLFPFVILYYFFNGKQNLQSTSLNRLSCRPHEGELYYEKRGFYTWQKMEACLSIWRYSDS